MKAAVVAYDLVRAGDLLRVPAPGWVYDGEDGLPDQVGEEAAVGERTIVVAANKEGKIQYLDRSTGAWGPRRVRFITGMDVTAGGARPCMLTAVPSQRVLVVH